MYKIVLVISLVFFSGKEIISQIIKTDSIQNSDTTIIVADSLKLNNQLDDNLDNQKNSIPQDTTLKINSRNDSLEITAIIDSITVIQKDTISLKDSITKVSFYDQFLNLAQDSLFFEEPDTTDFIKYSLRHLIIRDSLILSDTIKYATLKLINYITDEEIDTITNYLNIKLKELLLKEYQDSSLKIKRDSIFNAIEYLLKGIPEDSINLIFTNINKDSILFNVAEDQIDSVRFNLFDNRGEYATLWIRKSNVNAFNIYLEDGIYIEKARQRKVVNQRLETQSGLPGLRKVKKVNKILPMWKLGGLADIRFNQGYISDSWTEGGESSISTLSILKYSVDYTYGKIRNLDTDYEYRLGYIQAGENDLRKNDDKFEINAKYGRSAVNNWYYSALLNFKTQFFKGKEYINDSTVNVISEFLSPAYLVFSLGLDYKPDDKLTILISPITSKFTMVTDTVRFDQTRFGIGENEYVRKEIGAYIKAISKLKIRDNIYLENKINFFTNYMNEPQNIDVDLEVDLKVKLTDYISVSVNAHYIYDHDVDIPVFEDNQQVGVTKKGQFKELLGIGFVYSF